MALRKSRYVERISHRTENFDTQTGGKIMASTLNKLIFIVCCSVIAFVGLSFIDCTFIEPSIENRAKVMGTANVSSSEECKESESTGYETLLSVLTTIIALRTKLED